MQRQLLPQQQQQLQLQLLPPQQQQLQLQLLSNCRCCGNVFCHCQGLLPPPQHPPLLLPLHPRLFPSPPHPPSPSSPPSAPLLQLPLQQTPPGTPPRHPHLAPPQAPACTPATEMQGSAHSQQARWSWQHGKCKRGCAPRLSPRCAQHHSRSVCGARGGLGRRGGGGGQWGRGARSG